MSDKLKQLLACRSSLIIYHSSLFFVMRTLVHLSDLHFGRLDERVVEPLSVKRRGGELLLVAHCQLRNAQRTFKLERIVRLTRFNAASAA